MEGEPKSPFGRQDNSLAQILSEVIEEARLSIDRDINGADVLYSLLSAPWLYSLLRVYECLVQYSKDAPRPYLPFSSRISQEITTSVRGLYAPSPEAQELYVLLKGSHMQALLSAHDSVAQKDYTPVLPPIPDQAADDEEAVRIVCLVKNKQPLCVGERKPSYWNSLRRLTLEKLASAKVVGSEKQSLLGSSKNLSSSTALLSTKCPGQPPSLPRYQSTGSCNLCSQTVHLSGEGVNLSAPAVYDSMMMDNGEFIDAEPLHRWDQSPIAPCSSRLRSRLMPGATCCPPGCGLQAQTAPCTPLLQRHGSIDMATRNSHPALVLTKQRSLDELKSTIHDVASSMNQSTSDVRDLKQKMVAVTERMTDSVEENAQALSLLVEVVDKLQGLIIASKSPEVTTSSPRNISKMTDGLNSSPAKATALKFSNSTIRLRASSILSISSSSSASSFSSSSLSGSMATSHTASQHSSFRSSSYQTGNRTPDSKTKATSQAVSRASDDYGTILCISTKKKKSKMKK